MSTCGVVVSAASSGQDLIYDLIGVSNHMGGLGGGHYTACVLRLLVFGVRDEPECVLIVWHTWRCGSDCLNQDDQKWHCFNDSRVTSGSRSSLSGSAAYMLFYQRRGYKLPESQSKL